MKKVVIFILVNILSVSILYAEKNISKIYNIDDSCFHHMSVLRWKY